ncbi:MAG: GNAT family N-acetyltransferase [Gammaproteobacteria bacterium]|nr:GNAT family N-acetyltransferase [Gammaproteobacteria bacterium]
MCDSSIRLAGRADAAELSLMSRNLIERGLPWSWTPPRIQAAIDNAETNVVVAEDLGCITGFAVMSFAEDSAHLNLLAVRPSNQRQGLGRRLLRWLEAAAVTAGAWIIELEVRVDNVGARNFYRRLGYRTAATIHRYYDRSITAIQMRTDLSRPVASTGPAY